VTTRAVIEWLVRRRSHQTPFFVWVHYFDPHDALLLPPPGVLNRFPPRSELLEDRLRAAYDAEVFFMDGLLGRLFDALKAMGRWSDTLIVVVADHGQGLGDHDWWAHGILYQEQIRVPLVIRNPGGSAPRRVASLVRTIDIMPTVLRLAGVDPKLWPVMDGQDLTPLAQGSPPAGERVAYSDSLNILTYGRPGRKGGDIKDEKLYSIISAGGSSSTTSCSPRRASSSTSRQTRSRPATSSRAGANRKTDSRGPWTLSRRSPTSCHRRRRRTTSAPSG
jgi:hypothetical protein